MKRWMFSAMQHACFGFFSQVGWLQHAHGSTAEFWPGTQSLSRLWGRMCHPGLLQTNRYDRRMGCIGQVCFTYFGRYRDEWAGKNGGCFAFAFASLRRPLPTCQLDFTAFRSRAAQSLHAHTFCIGLGHLYTWQGGTCWLSAGGAPILTLRSI
jgi:hypothetical protein